MKKLFTPIFTLFSFLACGQNIDLHLDGAKDCDDDTYCVTLSVQSTGGDLQLGTSSLLLTYDEKMMSYRGHAPLRFAAGDPCGGDWLAQKTDGHSHPGQFELTLTLAENGASCPAVTPDAPVGVAIVCFDIIKQGGIPAVQFELENTQFNTHLPDDGTTWVPVGTAAEIFSENQLTCDCPGEGFPCDDGNIYTVNDKYDLDCHCLGEELDSDEDGILDGIDPCLDQHYEAEDAELTSVNVLNNQPQFSGLAFVDYNSTNNDAVEFLVTVNETGEHQMAFRYALEEGNRPMELSVDGVVIFDGFDFPASGSWADWDTVYHSMFFAEGDHSIKLRTNGSNGPNLDLLILSHCTDCQMAGMPCDDGNVCTTEDVFDADCNCGGKYLDDDFDGICNVLDQCPGSDDFLDSDGDGTPDGCDDCDNALVGTPCDDGNPCTAGDVYITDCQCVGIATMPDTDGDGVCDVYDICPQGDDNLDEDGDGIPDACDLCDDRTIGSPCNDGDPCTLLDMVQPGCGCAGIFFDSDGDGVCNTLDACPGFDDTVDNDGDGLPDACDPSVAISPKMEVGKLSGVGEDWMNVELENVYESPVVVATIQMPSLESPPVVTRIRNAEGDRFEIRIQVPGGTTDLFYDVQYLVAEEGIYTLDEDGVKMEAQRVMSTETGSAFTGYVREAREYGQAYSSPVVLGQVMTFNDEKWSVFWQSRANTQTSPADSESFAAGKHVAEDTLGARADEMLGIIIFEAGNQAWNGVKLESNVGEDIVEDAIGNDGFTYPIGLPSANRAVLSAAAMDGGNGYWPILFGTDPFRPNALIVAVDEDVIYDTDRYHTHEQLAYVAFEFIQTMSLQISATDNLCHGAATGTATALPAGGQSPYKFLWSNGATIAEIENLPAGDYSVTVTDELGTMLVAGVTVGEAPAIELTAEGSEVDCFGNENGTASAHAEGGSGDFKYLWNTGEEGQFLENLSAGIYTVTVTDDHGCTASASATVQSNSPLEVETENTDVLCFGTATATASASASGGAGTVEWLWSNGATTPEVENLTAGMYAVSATDDNGCVAVSSVEIGEPDELGIQTSATDATCFGTATATASASSAGGTGAIEWLWSNGATTPEVENLTAGIYTVTVTDVNGCEAISEVEIGEPDEFILETNDEGITCHGLNDGAISSSFSGGNGGVTYLWSNGETTAGIENLPPGEYSVTATDANGCEAVAVAEITEPDALAMNGNSENVTCFGLSDGEASVEATGGTGSFEYLWAHGQNGPVATDLPAGEYSVMATDANGCTITSVFEIAEPDQLLANATGTDVSCFGGDDGTGTVTSLGGTGTVNFEWSNGASGPMATGLPPGEYTVIATDANGCTSESAIEITEPTAIEITIENVVPATYSNPDGGASISVMGGAGDVYSFAWILNGNTISEMEDPTNLPPGEYTLQVTDQNGCVSTETVVIESLTSAAEKVLAAAISISPNPTSGEFILNIKGLEKMEFSVSISDAAGKVILEKYAVGSNTLFDLSEYAAGVYFVKIKSGEASVTRRVVRME